ncbi:hypothetical protein [Oceanithermus sp.]
MKQPRSGNVQAVVIWTLVIALLLGFAIGGFSAASRARAAVTAAETLAAGIPPSPVVTSARYDKAGDQLVLRVFNPGLVPVRLIDQSIVFKPGAASEQEAYALAAVPLGVEVAPLSIVEVELKLKPESKKLQPGDVVAASVSYTHPYSKDLYVLTHVFSVTEEAAKGKEQKEPAQPQMNKPQPEQGKGGK